MPSRKAATGPSPIGHATAPRHAPPNFDPVLPWGCWLRIETTAHGNAYVDDVRGETFPNLRSALWNGRLGMPNCNPELLREMLGILRDALAAAASDRPDDRGITGRTFEDDPATERWFGLWLAPVGLI